MDWRTRRKITIGSIVTFVLLMVISIPTYIIFFTGQPTCFDGFRNGDESGIDCGGECVRVCEAEVIPLDILSKESFKVSDGVFNSVVILENRNTDAGARDVVYTISISDSSGRILDTKEGVFDIPKQTKIALFAGGMRASMPLDDILTIISIGEIDWTKDAPQKAAVSVSLNPIENEDVAPRINGVVRNNSSLPSPDVQIVAIVSDDEGNPIAVSSTIAESLPKDAEKRIFFAWPEPFLVGSRVCDAQSGKKLTSFLGDVALVIDRSGSMDDEGANPPEPLNTVRLAAIQFVRNMTGTDRVALVSFANEATVDSGLTDDFDSVARYIDGISILTDVTQNTNLADGVLQAFTVLAGSDSENKRKAMVILTDGIATRPLDSSDKNYPENYARDIANSAKASGIEIYVIGLGKDLNTEFLQEIAGEPENYYGARTKDDLAGVYGDIALSICGKRPAIVTTYVIEK